MAVRAEDGVRCWWRWIIRWDFWLSQWRLWAPLKGNQLECSRRCKQRYFSNHFAILQPQSMIAPKYFVVIISNMNIPTGDSPGSRSQLLKVPALDEPRPTLLWRAHGSQVLCRGIFWRVDRSCGKRESGRSREKQWLGSQLERSQVRIEKNSSDFWNF